MFVIRTDDDKINTYYCGFFKPTTGNSLRPVLTTDVKKALVIPFEEMANDILLGLNITGWTVEPYNIEKS